MIDQKKLTLNELKKGEGYITAPNRISSFKNTTDTFLFALWRDPIYIDQLKPSTLVTTYIGKKK
jgi:hypothetical protein